jgi:hypothetical protein
LPSYNNEGASTRLKHGYDSMGPVKTTSFDAHENAVSKGRQKYMNKCAVSKKNKSVLSRQILKNS